MTLPKRNYIDISKKNQKGIIDSGASGTNFIFEQNEIANKREAELAQFHKEAEFAKQAREIEFKKKEMELLVIKQKAEELKKQKAEEKKFQEDKLALVKQQQEEELVKQKEYLQKKITQTDPAIYQQELYTKAKVAEEIQKNPVYISKKQELDGLLLAQKVSRKIMTEKVPNIDKRFINKVKNFEDDPERYIAEVGLNLPIHATNFVGGIINSLSELSYDIVNSVVPKDKITQKVEKLQADLKVFQKPILDLKHHEIEQTKNQKIALYKAETNPLKKHQLEVEIWKDEQAQKEIKNTINPSNKYVVGSLVEAVVGTTDFDKEKDASLGSELNRIHAFPRIQANLSEWFSRRDLEDKYQDVLVEKPGETPEQRKARFDSIPKEDLNLLKSYSLRDESKVLVEPFQSFGARQATNMESSLDMVALMLATEGMGAALGGVSGRLVGSLRTGKLAEKAAIDAGEAISVAKGIGAETASVSPKAFLEKGYIEQFEKGLIEKGTNKYLAKTASMALDGAQLSAKVQAMNIINPNFVNENLSKGSYVERDENGDIKNIYLQDKYYDFMKKMTFGYDTPDGQHIDGEKDSYVKRAAVLNRIQNRTTEQEQELDYIEQKLGKRTSLSQMTFEEDLETYKPMSKLGAYAKGFRQNLIETATEVYTGPLLGVVGKGLTKLPGVGKYAVKAEKVYEKIGSNIATSKANVVNSNKVFKYIDKNMTKINMPTFSGKTITGNTEEFIEEWVGSAANSLIDLDPKEFMDTTFDGQANVDIGLQTAFMKLGFGSMSVASTNSKLMVNRISASSLTKNAEKQKQLQKLYETSIEENKKEIDNQKEALKDDTLSEEERATKTKLIEDLETQNVSSKGTVTSMKKKAQTGRAFYQDLKDYTDSRNEIRQINNALRTAHLDSDINKIMNLASMSSTDLEAQKQEIERLKKEGVDTTVAEKILFNNVVNTAIKTGTLKDLRSSLEAASAKGSLSAETQQSLQRAMQNVAHLEEVSEKYQKHPYLNKILGMESEAFNLSEEVETAKRNTNNVSLKAVEAIKQIYPNRDFDISTIYDDVDNTFSEAELKQMTESNDAIQNHKTAYDLQNKFQEQLSKTNKVIGIFKNEAKHEVNKKNVNVDIRKQLADIQTAKDNQTDINDASTYLYDNTILEDKNIKFDEKGKLIIDKGLIDYLFEINEDNYVGDWKTSHKISKEALDNLKDNYYNKIDMLETFKKVQDIQTEKTAPEVKENLTPEFSKEVETETVPAERVAVNSKKYKTPETAAIALKQFEKPRKVKKGSHEVVQVDDYFIISKKLEGTVDEDIPLDPADNGTIEIVNTEEEQTGFIAIEENYNEALSDLLDSMFNEEVTFDLSIDNNENRFTPQQMALAKAYLEDYYNEMTRKVEKKDITFEKLFEQMFHYGTNKKAVEVLFPALAIVWRKMGNEFTSAQQASLFNKYYAKGIDRAAVEEAFLESFNNIYAETIVIEPVQTSLPEASQIISSDSSTNYNDDTELEDEIKAALEADKQLSDKERQSITPKAAFSSVKYTTYVDENGDVHRVSTATNFRDNNGVNFKELLDYDKYYTGYQAGVRVSTEEEWAGLSISNGRDVEGNINLIPFLSWLSEKENTDPNFRNTQEFTDRVPMFLLNEQGEKVSYLNDVAWYDTVNVYNPYGSSANQNNPSDMWQRHINKGIENVRELRNNVKAGLDKVTIERNSEEGIYLTLKKEAGQPTISISEANPQANIAVATSTTVNGLQHNNKELTQKLNDGSAIFLNKSSEIIIGHSYYVSRIGTTVLPNGKKVETYRAFEVLREVSESQVETVRNAYEMFQQYAWAVKNKDTKKIQDITENFIKPILRATGIDISKGFEKNGSIVYTGITDFIKMYFQADKKALQEVGVNSSDIHFAYERLFKKYSNADLAREANQLLSQHTSKLALKAKQMVEVSKDGKVTLLEKNGTSVSYEEYVKDNVKTNIKALNIGTAEEPKYVTVIQPIINIIGKPVIQPEIQTSEKIAKTTKTIVEEIKTTTEEAKNKPAQLEKNITQKEKEDIEKFFNKLNINIDYEDIDEAIDNLDTINKLFNTSGNLDFKQEHAIKQFLIGKITRYLIDNKVDISKPITVETKGKIFDALKVEINQIVKDRTEEVNVVKENLKTFVEDDTTKKINETVNATLDNLKTLTDEYEAIFNKAFDKLKIDSKVIEEEEGDNSDVGIEDKNYSKESIETDLKKGVTPNLRLFLNSISQYDKQGNKVITYLGLDSYMEFNEIFNQLIKNIAIGIDIPSDYNILIETLKKSKAPFIKDVLEKLENADEQVKNTFLTTFVKHSLNSKSAQYSQINNSTKLKILENDSNEGKRVVKKEYLNVLKTSGVYNQNGTVNLNFVNDLITRYESLFKEYPDNTLTTLEGEEKQRAENQIRMLLEQSGLIMQDDTWQDILNGKFFNKGYKTLNDLFTLDNGGLLKPIFKFLKTLKEGDIYENEKNILSDLGGVTNAIIKLEVANDTSLNSTSFRDSGKNISKLVPTKYITDKVMDLKRSVTDKDNKLIDNLQNLSFSKDSVILQLLSEYPEFQSIFSISHVGLEAMKEAGKPVYGKSGITDISDLDYFLATFTGFQDRRSEKLTGATIDGFPIRIANMLNLTMSDKSTNTYLQTGVFDFMASPLSFASTEEGKLTLSPEVRELMIKQLVKPELERIANFYNTVKSTNISDYDKATKIFHLLPLLNTVADSKGIRLIDKMAMMDNIDPNLLLKEYNQQFSEIVVQVVEEEINHFKEIAGDKLTNMFDSEYFTEINAEKNLDKAMYDFVLNSMIHQADLFKVFAGDISNYAKDKQVAETGLDNKTTNEQYISLNKQIGVNLGKRLALLIAPGNKIANSYTEKYHQIFLQDSVDISENAKYLMDLYYPEKNKVEVHTALEKYNEIAENINKYEQGLVEVSPEILEQYRSEQDRIREFLQKEFPSIKDYFDIESTDAQEYTTAKEHVNILFKLGRLNIEQYKRIMDNIENDVHLSKEDLKFVLQPIKPVHTGTYYNEKWDVNRVVYIKTSSFPLLKQFTGSTKLDALRVKMEELEAKTGQGVRASYKTGNKVGAVKSNNEINPFDVQSLENIFNGFDATTNTFDENGLTNSVLTLDRNNFRIQQDVPFKSDKKKVDTVAMSTQFFKMLFGDEVVQEYDEKDREKFATFSLDGKMITGKELYNHYTKSFEKLVNTKKQQLFRELDMSPEGVITNKLAFTQKLQAMLVKEATEKGYSLKSVRGLTIEKLQAELGYHYDFKTPLWLSTDSNRYESLLNSLVTNRILQHKIPGNSYVAGSESGFRMKENLEGIDQSRIIYLDNYNGKELQGTHTTTEEAGIVFHKAQVFVPSKFKTSKNELIDLFEGFNEESGSVANAKYLKRNENGSLGLKEEMLDKELLNLFSFRTPTSSHVSGASIEIVGFLPSIQGDLMIVPKNFTKQKGLDYDVDKEGTYMLNHVTNREGKIEILTEKHKYNSLKTLRNLLADENNIYRSDVGLPGMEAFYEIIRAEFGDDFVSEMQNEGANLESKIKSMELEYDKKLAENEFIKVHLAVYNNPSVNIQQKINKVLSIDIAKKQAQQLEQDNILKERAKFISERKLMGATDAEALAQYETRQKSFTMLSYIYQKDKMNFGAIGKTAIGVYANATTLSSLMQQNENEISLADNGLIQIGDLIFDGKFGKISTLNGSRSIADVLAERENIATDNEKEQVLTKVGVTAETINVDALLTLAGFDTVKYNDMDISIPFYLLSQPAITDFNNTIKNSKGVLGGYVDKNALINLKILDLSGKKISYIKQGDGTYLFVNTKDGSEIKDFNGKVLTAKNLVNGVKSNGQDLNVQASAFMTYINLNEKAKVLQKVQSVINTNDLGKSMVGSKLKYEKLKTLSENGEFNNIEKLLGDFVRKEDVTEKPVGSYDIGDYYITPTTPQGQIVINGLHIGNTIFKDFFPFQSVALSNTVKEITEGRGRSFEDISEEEYEEIIDELKRYIFSNKNNNIFNGEIDAVRFDLFKDTDTHTSLSTYVHSLIYNKKSTKAIKSIKENALLKQLSFNLNFDPALKTLSTMTFNNTDTGTNSQEDLYNSIPELIKNNYKLPDRNGMPYNTRMLATDLVAYAYLEGGIQEATQFVKVIPVEVLETLGNYKEIKQVDGSTRKVFINANTQLQKYNPSKYNKTGTDPFGKILGINEFGITDFTRQYFQHNLDKAKRAPNKHVIFEKNDGVTTPPVFSFNPKFLEGSPLPFLRMNGALYEHRGNLDYYMIETIGGRGISEYKYGERNAVNFDVEEKEVIENQNPAPVKQTTDVTANFENIKNINDALAEIKNLSLAENHEFLKVATEFLTQFQDSTTKFEIASNSSAAGSFYSVANKVTLHNSTLTDSNKTAMTLVHEYIHSITSREIMNYYQADGVTLKEGVSIPSHVKDLDEVFSKFREQFATEIAEITDKKQGLNKDNFTEDEKNIYYAGYNIKEFMAVALTSVEFQNEMNKVPYSGSNKSFMNKILDAIMKIVDTIYPELKKDTVAHEAISKSMRFIIEEQGNKKTSKTIKLLTGEDLSLVNLADNQIGLGQIDTSKEVMNQGGNVEYIDKNQTKLFENETLVEDLRQEEQQELRRAFPNAVETNGKIEKSSLTTKEDKTKFDEIYDKFDKLITPLLEQDNKDEMISNNLSTFDTSIENLGITKEEWDNLSQEEQDRIKKCN